MLKRIELAEKDLRALGEQAGLGRLLSVVLDSVFVGEEQRGWQFFAETYTLPDKSRIRSDTEKLLRKHPVYRYLREPTAIER